jgi:predicted O-linked N-acetylglucosamine transferase (SPINDLY family)
MLLFSRKPAPVQVTWIGYPATTGLSAIDYKIVDSYTDPPGLTERYYTEKLVRLDDCYLCYLPDRESPEIGSLPALSNGYITFGSFNNFAKVTPGVMQLWAGIMRAVPDSRLVLKANSLSDTETKKYVMNIYDQEGISGERIELCGWEPSSKVHMETYNRIDIALDTFPYNGTTTTCEALYMGVPVVSLAGSSYASRTGISLLSNVGLTEIIGHTPAEYLNIAVQLAVKIDHLRKLRSGLREMMVRSPMMNAGQFVLHLEERYRMMWKKWCTHPDGGS